MIAALLSSLAALAADGVPLDPPLPVRASAGRWEVRAFGLPPMMSPEAGAEGLLRCGVRLELRGEGPATVEVRDCPETWREAAGEAAGRWVFAPLGEAVAAQAELRFVQRVDGLLGATGVWAELDPGPEHADLEGRPGLKLVRPPALRKPLPERLPGRLRGRGFDGQSCAARVRVGEDGRAAEVEVPSCPGVLAAHARGLLLKARFEPASVDGQLRAEVLELALPFRD